MIFQSEFYLILLTVLLFSCYENDSVKTEYFGKLITRSELKIVEVKLIQYDSFKQISDRVEKIVCHDSIPMIELHSKENKKLIFFQNPCWKNYGCILIRLRNIFKIKNDTIFKGGFAFLPDSLEYILRKDIENKDKDILFSQGKERLIISISYDEKEYRIDRLLNTLDRVTDAYKKITDTTDMIIFIEREIPSPPPPPPPPDEES